MHAKRRRRKKKMHFISVFLLLLLLFLIAAVHALINTYRPRLRDQMQYCTDHPEEVSKLSRVKAQVDQVKSIMMENIDKVTTNLR
jgi:hypothetical protein